MHEKLTFAHSFKREPLTGILPNIKAPCKSTFPRESLDLQSWSWLVVCQGVWEHTFRNMLRSICQAFFYWLLAIVSCCEASHIFADNHSWTSRFDATHHSLESDSSRSTRLFDAIGKLLALSVFKGHALAVETCDNRVYLRPFNHFTCQVIRGSACLQFCDVTKEQLPCRFSQ